MDPVAATRLAAIIGRCLAVLFMIGGLFFSPALAIVGLFVWFSAGQEVQQARVRRVLTGIPVTQAMTHDFLTVAPDDNCELPLNWLRAGLQQDFPVVVDGHVIGMLLHRDLEPLATDNRQFRTKAGALMRHDFAVAYVTESADPVTQRLRGTDWQAAPVLDGARLVGMVSLRDIVDQVIAVMPPTAAVRGVMAMIRGWHWLKSR